MPRNLDLAALRSFVTVVDAGGVTKAASQLHLTQSAVSMQLKRLEESMGVALMDRSARKIGLTGQGELLLGYARRLLELNDEAWGRLTADKYEGEIAFGVPHDIVYPHIPEVLKRFSAAYPKVKVRLVSSYTVSLKEAYKNGKLDIILTTEVNDDPKAEHLARVDLVWVGALNGRAWKQRPVQLAAQQRCVFRKMAQRALEEQGIPWEMAADTDSSMTVSACLSADIGIEARLANAVPGDLELIDHAGALPCLPYIDVNLYVSSKPQNTLAEALAEIVREAYNDTSVPQLVSAG